MEACTPLAACGPCPGGAWVDVDFLLWWRDRRRFPPLVTTQPNDGILPDATVLVGGEVDEQGRPGGRLEFGLWLDPCHAFGIGGRYLGLGEAPFERTFTSDELGFFARPFVDVSGTPPTSTALQIANDQLQPPRVGQLDLRTNSDVQAADFFLRWALGRWSCADFDFLVGYQFARIDEDLLIDALTSIPVGEATQSFAVTDIFDAKNEYHAAYFGFQGEYLCGCWGLELLVRFGFGNMRQTVNIAGSTTAIDAEGNVDERNSGLLAQAATNGGLHTQDKFSYMQDAGIKLVYYPIDRLRLSVGYSLMYWSSVERLGGAIDLGVDGRLLTALPPADATRPAFAFAPSGFYVQGFNLGAEFKF
jgi:hypothetical protein